MKMISVGKSAAKLEAGLQRAEDLRNVQSENANLTALVLKASQGCGPTSSVAGISMAVSVR
jgi:hypothetical protein